MMLTTYSLLAEPLFSITNVYWIIAIPATLVFLVQLALTFFNAESKTSSVSSKSAANNEEAPIIFILFNFRNIIGFFTAFGWSGLACIDVGLSNTFVIFMSIVCGCILALTMAIVFYFIKKLMRSVKEGLE